MNLKPKQAIKIIFSLLIIALLSCESEHIQYESEIKTTEKINIVDLDSVPFLKSSINNFNNTHSKTSSFGKSEENILSSEIVLNTSEILEFIRENGEKTYSIKIYSSISPNEKIYFENLHIVPTKKGYKSYILRWTPNDPNEVFAVHTFNGTVKWFDINYNLKNQVTILNGKILKNVTGKPSQEAPKEKNCYEISDCYCHGNNIGVHDCTLGLMVAVECDGGSSEDPGDTGEVNPQDPTYPGGSPSDDPPPVGGGGGSYVVPNYSLKEQQFVQSLGSVQASYFNQLRGLATLKVFNYLKVRNYDSEVTAPAKNGLLRVDLNWLKNQTQSAQIAIMDFLTTNYFSLNSTNIVNSLKEAINNNPNLQFDIPTSLKSPMNIDRSSITDATPEGKKFNQIYDQLIKSPLFQKLFINIFDSSNRFNVKFEIVEHAYEKNDPTKKEVNATTSKEPNTNYIIIKISKQILFSGIGTLKNQITIENAKTILHECIHAYLFVKENNPNIGSDFVSILNITYPTADEQHNFMYDFMIPTMQGILSEIRDNVTTIRGRNVLENDVTMHPTQNPLTSTPWIWDEYYKYLSVNGLEETKSFIKDFPINSDKWNLLSKYLEYGHNELDR